MRALPDVPSAPSMARAVTRHGTCGVGLRFANPTYPLQRNLGELGALA